MSLAKNQLAIPKNNSAICEWIEFNEKTLEEDYYPWVGACNCGRRYLLNLYCLWCNDFYGARKTGNKQES